MSKANDNKQTTTLNVPWFGARKIALNLLKEAAELRNQRDNALKQLEKLGALTVAELESRRIALEREIEDQSARLAQTKAATADLVSDAERKVREARSAIVATEDWALLQEAGIYHYRHPLTDAVAYEAKLNSIEAEIKAMTRKDGGAVEGTTNWTVNGSAAEGRKMVRDFSKLMLRAFNAEADVLVRGLKPYKLEGAVDRLTKVAETIERLGRTMQIKIAAPYFKLRIKELELTADFLHAEAERKEAEREEREKLREERKAQQEIERERARLEKERQHYSNALDALIAKGDEAGTARLREQLDEITRAMTDVEHRAANIRAGYVYLISNIGSFGEQMIKVGMTRRLDPMDRIRELSDASVPFNFDVHALFFSDNALNIEAAMHQRLADRRVNAVNRRREFFKATPLEAKVHLLELTGELLHFEELAEALEYRQTLKSYEERSKATT